MASPPIQLEHQRLHSCCPTRIEVPVLMITNGWAYVLCRKVSALPSSFVQRPLNSAFMLKACVSASHRILSGIYLGS